MSPSLGIVAVLCSLGTSALLEGRRLARHKGQQGAAILQGSQRRPLGVSPFAVLSGGPPRSSPEQPFSLPSSPQQLTFFLKGGSVGGPSDGTHLGGLYLAGAQNDGLQVVAGPLGGRDRDREGRA